MDNCYDDGIRHERQLRRSRERGGEEEVAEQEQQQKESISKSIIIDLIPMRETTGVRIVN